MGIKCLELLPKAWCYIYELIMTAKIYEAKICVQFLVDTNGNTAWIDLYQ